jgi:glycosyltransferase involved in cell wall biosynthesis
LLFLSTYGASLKFSIVIPSYNQAEFLERTLRSIIDQGVETEIIVIDGGSSDNSVDIIKKYESKIAYWVSEKDRGQSHALNKGFAMATGDIFGWQNSDDVYMPGAFKKVLEAFEQNPEKKIVYGNWHEIDENDNVIDKTYSAPKPRIPHFSYEGFDCYNQTMFWKREVHERFGHHDERLHMLMDGDMIFRFIFNEGVDAFHKIDDFLAAFRRTSTQKSPDDHLNETTILNEKMLAEKFGFPDENSFLGKYYRVRHRFAKLWWHITQGGFKYTWKKFWRGYRKRGKVF